MIHYCEEKNLPFSRHDLFNLVANIKEYPQFLPWCAAARIKSQTDTLIRAELVIRYILFKTAYTSRVHLNPDQSIEVIVEEGPLKVLSTYWQFDMIDEKSTAVKFDLNLELTSSFLQTILEKIFKQAAQEMMTAFEKRAQKLYGKHY